MGYEHQNSAGFVLASVLTTSWDNFFTVDTQVKKEKEKKKK